jgi:hypothetical protein
MAEWRPLYPKDVETEMSLWEKNAERRTMRVARAEKRRRKAFIVAQITGPMIGNDDDRWEELFLTSEERSGDNFDE